MDLSVVLSLCDQEGISHRRKPATFNRETTIEQLCKTVNCLWNIDEEYQDLYFKEHQILSLSSTLQQIGVKNDDEIVVRHSHLDHWIAYMNRVEEFKKLQVSDAKKRSAETAQRFYDLLLASSFFTVYAKFDIEITKYHKPISKYLDKRTRYIQNAVINFFKLSMFKGQNAVVQFEETEDGTRSAVICDITVNSMAYKYRVKTNHNAGESRQASRFYVIELFCYKFLEKIGTGPKIVFIPNCVTSKSIIYIGSEWMPDFRSFNSVEKVIPTELFHAVVEIHFLTAFLSLGDMHEENFGINGRSDPIIVDFMMSNYGDPKTKFLHDDYIIRSIRARDILKSCDSTTRLRIAKEAVEKWNFMDKLDEVLQIMDKEKADFDRKKLDFEKKTKDLENFIEKVKSNVIDLFHD